jgi:CRISPR-associated protein Csb2
MLGVDVHFLTGRYAATAYQDRSRAEWPPHPARLFSALVDALHSDDEVDAEEAAALDRLAELGPPEVLCGEAHPRRVMTSFVPVNDVATTDAAELMRKEAALRAAETARRQASTDAAASTQVLSKRERAASKARETLRKAAHKHAGPGKGKDGAEQVLPWLRVKQPRTFPVVLPTHPVASFVWPAADLGERHREALQRLGARVHRLGHSSSLVHLHLPDAVQPEGRQRWLPNDDGSVVLRVPQVGQRAALDAAFDLHRGEQPGRVLPSAFQRYAVDQAGQDSLLSERSRGRWFVYELGRGSLPPAHATVPLAEAVRGALLHHAGDGASSMLTGHAADGSVLDAPHLAVIPLPFVGHRHADGLIRGFALSLPSGVGFEQDRALLAALARMEEAGDSDAREVWVQFGGERLRARRVVDEAGALATLRRSRWAGPARRWTTVTPIALDGECDPFQHPRSGVRNKARKTAARLIRKSVVHALAAGGRAVRPDDIGVELVFEPAVRGGAHPRRVPRFQRAGHRRPRRLVHARIELPLPLVGPLVLGAGRHFGLGLCMPLRDREETHP